MNITEGALLPAVSNLGSTVGVDDEYSLGQIEIHVVKEGETIADIANMYEISQKTVAWANDMKVGDKLVVGDTLIILPMDGARHIVAKGDTLKKIADKYDADINDMLVVNENLTINTELAIGQEIIVPGAEIITPVATNSKNTSKKKITYNKVPVKNISGYFTNPVPGFRRISQRKIHANNGVDLAAPTGTPIVAAASGKVIFARVGYNGGYGNMTIVRHSNGTETLYAHQSKIIVKVGDQVSQGEVIGYVGSTGRSTGPHLHYEVHGAKNNATSL